MKKLLVCILFISVGCSTQPTQKNKVPTKESFKAKKSIEYNKSADFFKKKATPENEALVDESLFRLEKSAQPAEGKDVINSILISCYKKNFKEGLDLAKANTFQFAKVPTFWNQLGTCYLLKGEERKALLYYNKALELSPAYTPSLNNIGVIYTRKNQYQKALIAFQKAQQNSRFSKTPRFNMAQLYLSFGLSVEAIPLFQSLIGDSPRDVDVLAGLANANYLLGDFAKAYEIFNRIPDNFRSRADVGINFARTAKNLGKKEEAVALLSNVKKVPSNYKNYYEESRKKIEGN